MTNPRSFCVCSARDVNLLENVHVQPHGKTSMSNHMAESKIPHTCNFPSPYTLKTRVSVSKLAGRRKRK